MSRIGKIILYSLLTVVVLAIAFAISAYWALTHVDHDKDLDQQVQLSNSAFLKVHGEETPGPDSGYSWQISYRDKAPWEKVGEWWDGGRNSSGNVIACPIGKLIVVTRMDGLQTFVRTEAGSWKTFLMEITGPSPFSKNGELGPNLTSLETAEIETIRSRMLLTATDGSLRPEIGQFLPQRQELWLDFVTPAKRRFRIRLKLFGNGEKFRFLDSEEQAFNKNKPDFDQITPDTPIHPACDKVEFFRSTADIAPSRGVALLLDPQHPSSMQSVEGWRIRNFEGAHSDRIYLILHGKKRLIPNMDVYKNLFGTDDLSAVHPVGAKFDDIREGDPFSADAAIWRFPDKKMYLYDTGEFHWMNAGVAHEYGFDHASMRTGETYLLKDHTGTPLGPL